MRSLSRSYKRKQRDIEQKETKVTKTGKDWVVLLGA